MLEELASRRILEGGGAAYAGMRLGHGSSAVAGSDSRRTGAFSGQQRRWWRMQDYRDLVAVGLALVCAGLMLVGGQLYIEHGPIEPSTDYTEWQGSSEPQMPVTSRVGPIGEGIRAPIVESQAE